MEIKRIQPWQLTKLVDRLRHEKLPDLDVVGFKFHEGGVSKLNVSPFGVREIRTLGRAQLQWYKDTYARLPHVLLQVEVKGENIVLIGFWSDDIDRLREIVAAEFVDITAGELLTAKLGDAVNDIHNEGQR